VAFFSFDFTGNRSIVRGDDWTPSFRWLQRVRNPDGTTTDTPIDLTGYIGTVRLTKPGSDALVISPAPLVTVDAEGHISWNIPAATTIALPKGELILAVPLTDTTGRTSTRIFGTVRVL
jgi:hypothetical protein